MAVTPRVPRVFLYDSTLRRVGQISTAAHVNRSYRMSEPGLLDFEVAADDPIVSELSPIDGRIAVVESDFYPWPWAGKITSLRRSRAEGSLRVSADSFERIFEHRFTGPALHVSGSASDVVRRVLEAVNSTNGTGVEAGRIAESTTVATTDLVFANAREALDQLADLAGFEWWVEPFITASGLQFLLNFAPWRGTDQFSRVQLVDGGSCRWSEWAEDGSAYTFGLTVLGGSGLASTGSGAKPSASSSAVQLVGPHGYRRFGPEEGAGLLSRQDRFVVASQLRGAGLVKAAAEAMLANQRLGGVPRTAGVQVPMLDKAGASMAPVWKVLEVGTIVHLVLPDAFASGFDGPAHIRGVQPMEQDGDMELALELLRAPP